MTSEDSEKIRELYEIYEQPMFRIAYAVLHDSALAEDAVSDAFIRIIGKLDRLKAPDSPKTKQYIVKTIKSTSINIYRKNRRLFERELPIDEETMQMPDSQQNVENTVIDYVSSDPVREMIADLNETDRKIIQMRCSKEMSWKEVAASLSLTEVNARKRFERTKKRLISLKGEFTDEK